MTTFKIPEWVITGAILLFIAIVTIFACITNILIDRNMIEINNLKETIIELEENNKLLEQKLIEKSERLNYIEEQLEKKQTLINDNTSLRETIKTLSSRGGAAPRNYSLASNKDNNLHNYYLEESLGTCTISFYTPSADECGNDLGITASSRAVIPGYTVAVDRNHHKLGTLFYIEGWGIVEAMDTGSAIKGRKRFDLCIFNKEKALSLGIQKRKVWRIDGK